MFLKKSQKEWIDHFEGMQACCEPVCSFDEVFASPYVKERGLVEEIEHPTESTIKQLRLPIKFSNSSAGDIRNPPPIFSQHTNEILRDIGYNVKEILSFREDGVI